ncbi:MAG: hypothetical protein WD772_00060 [Pseudohongiellaceae bacterium]
MKALQYFSDEALERGRKMSTEEVLRFLEEFRLRYAAQYFAEIESRNPGSTQPLSETQTEQQ